jgi:predicted DNA-binding protein (UPF0251 family)
MDKNKQGKEIKMSNLLEILRLSMVCKRSQREIASLCKVSQSTVQKYWF